MKKVSIAIIFSFVLVLSILLISKNNVPNFGDVSLMPLVGTEYSKPMIIEVYNLVDKISIKAGIYHFGDINQDGAINYNDVYAMDYILYSKLDYTDNQKRLADLDNNGIINYHDAEILKEYLNNNLPYQYDLKTDLLRYCFIEDSIENCKWNIKEKQSINNSLDYQIIVKREDIKEMSTIYSYHHVTKGNNDFKDYLLIKKDKD